MGTRIVILMGTSGVGKSSVGLALARSMGCTFIEGDDFHSHLNKKKMNDGFPLNDADREIWLSKLSTIAGNAKECTVIACSALKKIYRRILSNHTNRTIFVHLKGSKEEVTERLNNRTEHFFNSVLLDSQFATLEPLSSTEDGFEVQINQEIDLIVAEIITSLNDLYS